MSSGYSCQRFCELHLFCSVISFSLFKHHNILETHLIPACIHKHDTAFKALQRLWCTFGLELPELLRSFHSLSMPISEMEWNGWNGSHVHQIWIHSSFVFWITTWWTDKAKNRLLQTYRKSLDNSSTAFQIKEMWQKSSGTQTACIFEETIGHVNNIPTMQIFTGISKNTQSKSYMLSLTECVRDFQNYALWDTH